MTTAETSTSSSNSQAKTAEGDESEAGGAEVWEERVMGKRGGWEECWEK